MDYLPRPMRKTFTNKDITDEETEIANILARKAVCVSDMRAQCMSMDNELRARRARLKRMQRLEEDSYNE